MEGSDAPREQAPQAKPSRAPPPTAAAAAKPAHRRGPSHLQGLGRAGSAIWCPRVTCRAGEVGGAGSSETQSLGTRPRPANARGDPGRREQAPPPGPALEAAHARPSVRTASSSPPSGSRVKASSGLERGFHRNSICFAKAAVARPSDRLKRRFKGGVASTVRPSLLKFFTSFSHSPPCTVFSEASLPDWPSRFRPPCAVRDLASSALASALGFPQRSLPGRLPAPGPNPAAEWVS